MKRMSERGHSERVERGSRLYDELAKLYPNGSVFHLLTCTPEQAEDVYAVLVDDRCVVSFEIRRNDADAVAEDVKSVHVEQYRRGIRGIAQADLRAARDLARACLKGS